MCWPRSQPIYCAANELSSVTTARHDGGAVAPQPPRNEGRHCRAIDGLIEILYEKLGGDEHVRSVLLTRAMSLHRRLVDQLQHAGLMRMSGFQRQSIGGFDGPRAGDLGLQSAAQATQLPRARRTPRDSASSAGRSRVRHDSAHRHRRRRSRPTYGIPYVLFHGRGQAPNAIRVTG